MLPFVALFLFIAVNDRSLMGRQALNGGANHAVMARVVFAALVPNVPNVVRATGGATGLTLFEKSTVLGLAGTVALLLAVPIARTMARRRRL